jgi:hypothetical protein
MNACMHSFCLPLIAYDLIPCSTQHIDRPTPLWNLNISIWNLISFWGNMMICSVSSELYSTGPHLQQHLFEMNLENKT